MYCKYCAAALDQNNARKCPNCGADINLLDGGQSFFEDADIQIWREKEQNDSSTPKTVLRPSNNFSKQEFAPSWKTSDTGYYGHNKEGIIKLAIICGTALIALALIVVLIMTVLGNNSKKFVKSWGDVNNDNDNEFSVVHNLKDLTLITISGNKEDDDTITSADNNENSVIELKLNFLDKVEKAKDIHDNHYNLGILAKVFKEEPASYKVFVSIDNIGNQIESIEDLERLEEFPVGVHSIYSIDGDVHYNTKDLESDKETFCDIDGYHCFNLDDLLIAFGYDYVDKDLFMKEVNAYCENPLSTEYVTLKIIRK